MLIPAGLKFDFRCGAAEAVVVSEKSVGLLSERLLKTPVDLASRLEKCANIALQEPLTMFAVNASEQRGVEKCEERAVFPGAIRHLKARNRTTIVIYEI